MELVSGSCSSRMVDVELVACGGSLCRLQLQATDADTCGFASMQRAASQALCLLPGRIRLLWGSCFLEPSLMIDLLAAGHEERVVTVAVELTTVASCALAKSIFRLWSELAAQGILDMPSLVSSSSEDEFFGQRRPHQFFGQWSPLWHCHAFYEPYIGHAISFMPARQPKLKLPKKQIKGSRRSGCRRHGRIALIWAKLALLC